MFSRRTATILLAMALALAAGLFPPAAQAEPKEWLLPDLTQSTWLPKDSRQEDTSCSVPYKDTYMEVWQTTGKRQSAEFRRFYELDKYYAGEKFLFYIFRVLNTGRVFQVNMEVPDSNGVCLVDSEGKGVFHKKGSIYDEPQMPPWAVAMARQTKTKTYFPLPEFQAGADLGIQKFDIFPQVPGKETTVHRYRLMDGSHLFIKSFPNNKVWGYDHKKANKPKVSIWALKWNRSYDRKDQPPKPDLADYGLPAR
ncbi:MAG: hypothetical protein K9K66_05960 [Desulfarculaceae bacterium]|nr:hypothetical protein [Desulfarculaceae bacterium]MCF8071209.1 hypothetical protein [Desulfarculaceae bacterium]MCF8101188.1 hypothetical protein [Desulfarculaceae bacterium]MCF8115263.1 hypothetical protein [Desulfarculaceae bacterium]